MTAQPESPYGSDAWEGEALRAEARRAEAWRAEPQQAEAQPYLRTRTGAQPHLRTQADVHEMWTWLLRRSSAGPPEDGASTWLMLIGADDVPVSPLIELSHEDHPTPQPPTRQEIMHLSLLLRTLAAEIGQPGLRVAPLRARPGPSKPDADDRAWAHAYSQAARLAAMPAEVMHLAGDQGVLPLPIDEIGFGD